MNLTRLVLMALMLVGACEQSVRIHNPGPNATLNPDAPDADGFDLPIANAGPQQQVAPLEDVRLDGTASYDPSGLPITAYAWDMVSRPPGSTTELNDETSATPVFFADLAGLYEFKLVVQNSAGVWSPEPDTVIIEAIPADNFYVQLTWNTRTDLDLHLRKDDNPLWRKPFDCNFCNPEPDWGTPESSPSLDIDAIQGWGPETITILEPSEASYRINVHYYGANGNAFCLGGCPDAEATVRLYLDGELAYEWVNTLSRSGDVWDVATLHWPSLRVDEHESTFRTQRSTCID